MLDALIPALEAAQQAEEKRLDLVQLVRRSSAAAEAGAKETIPMIATKGRASYLGERSRGHQDPGATSSWLLLRALSTTLEEQQ
jgi:dihydroxyacetone kinase-like protein